MPHYIDIGTNFFLIEIMQMNCNMKMHTSQSTQENTCMIVEDVDEKISNSFRLASVNYELHINLIEVET